MKCEDCQELILEREWLAPGQEIELGQHLSSCDDCRAWARALTEVEATLTAQLCAELNPSVLGPRIARAVARERIWTAGVPELLDSLGWSALGILAMMGLLLWSNWQSWRLWLAGAGTLAASLVWAGRVLWKEHSETGRLP